MGNDQIIEVEEVSAVVASDALSDTPRGVHDPEIVQRIIEMDVQGISGRKIAEEMSNQEITRDDIFAVLRHFRVWTSWKRPDTQSGVGRGVGHDDGLEDGEKVTEMVRKIADLEEKSDRILTERVALARELKRVNEDTAGLKKWVDQFKPESDQRIEELTRECTELTIANRDLRDQLEHKPMVEVLGVNDTHSIYMRGREAGREETRQEVEAQGTSWLTYLLIPLIGVAGIVAGALLTWVMS